VIRGVHTMFYSSQAEQLREFIRDKLGFPCTDVGGGWLIFHLPEADMGCHPVERDGPPSGTHYISFYCDDIRTTMKELKDRGVRFDDEISEEEYGLTVHFTMPGDVRVELYQPLYMK
jgi:catechol 2,3-dioxygenase-like lactoylglutathione lyase family enzyme